MIAHKDDDFSPMEAIVVLLCIALLAFTKC